jgi:hypothetical protein
MHQKLAVHVRSTRQPNDDDVILLGDPPGHWSPWVNGAGRVGTATRVLHGSLTLFVHARVFFAQPVTIEINSEANIMASKAMVPTMSNVFSYGSLVHAIAGAVGGATAITVRVSAGLNPRSLFFNLSCSQNDH